MPERLWHIRSGSVDEFVQADDQWEAWDTMRERPLEDFALIATAEREENADPVYVRLPALLFRWGRDEEAEMVAREVAAALGLPDTTEHDREIGRA